ncbi:MAG: hypothetical protein IPH95_14295 [Candidatus Promineofilum sp.]|nr:hypothetical protein [Promineifilum sp.]
MNNTLGFILCLLYVFGMIGLAELLRRWRGYGSGFTRKVIHIGVGMMSWFLPPCSRPPGRSSPPVARSWSSTCSTGATTSSKP